MERQQPRSDSMSWAVVYLGMTIGLFYWLVFLPVALFSVSSKESRLGPAFLAINLVTFLPLCVLAVFRRRVAGLCMIIFGVLSAVAGSWQAVALQRARGFPVRPLEIFGYGLDGVIVAVTGAFLLFTGLAGWPELKGRHRE